MRYIGMDVHREFAQLAVVEDGLVRDEGRIGVTPEALRDWAAEPALVMIRWRWRRPATATRSRTLLAAAGGRVVVSNPSKTRAIAEAKVKTDKVDARILGAAAGGGLPAAGVAAGRRGPGLAPAGDPPCAPGAAADPDQEPGARDLGPQPAARHRRCRTCSGPPAGTGWPGQALPVDERSTVTGAAAAAGLPRRGADHGRPASSAVEALTDPVVARLMTIPGVDAIAAISIVGRGRRLLPLQRSATSWSPTSG